jgi:hypothetical protein
MAEGLRITKNNIKLHSTSCKTDRASDKHGLSRNGTGMMAPKQEFQKGLRRGAGQCGMWGRMKV